MQIDKQVDAYIANTQDFAQPILTHLRNLIHQTHPDIVETMKWGMPHFEYKGIVASMAAFKQHVAFGFWKERLIPGIKKYTHRKDEAMGSMGRITKLSDLPPDEVLTTFIQKAVELNEKGIKVVKKGKKTERNLDIPDYFMKLLRKNKKTLETFERFSFSNKKEYVEWITEAKTEETRNRRIAQSLEWLAEGKVRNWKYMRK